MLTLTLRLAYEYDYLARCPLATSLQTTISNFQLRSSRRLHSRAVTRAG